jgi:hypothetical protein
MIIEKLKVKKKMPMQYSINFLLIVSPMFSDYFFHT